EGAPLVERTTGNLVGDDSMPDKPYGAKMALVTRHWSSKHHAVVDDINPISLVWTDGDRILPMDYRVSDKTRDGITKNAHLLAMLLTRMPSGADGHRVGHDEGRDHSPCGALLSRPSIVYPPRICVSPTRKWSE
ncbi:MAG: hypothetical protein M3008_10515, partial [Chloroflexota bacterium]|nr:hypothetical protein [Chloroflexota bacterium]